MSKESKTNKTKMTQWLNKFTEEAVEYLGVESLPIVFRDDIVDVSRLSLEAMHK